jgi:hypothetical protein
MSAERIEGAKLLASLPPGAGKCVGLVLFKERVIIACEFGVFEYFPDTREAGTGKLEQIMFVSPGEGMITDIPTHPTVT